VPKDEGRVSRILDHVTEGGLSNDGPQGEIVVGKTLASSLGVRVGEELAVVSQAADGTVGNDLFRVAGIVDVGISHLNRMLAVAHLEDAQTLLALEDWQVHEIVLKTVSPLRAPVVCEEINSSGLLPSGSIAESWSELLPQLKEYLRLAEGMGWFLISLVGVFAAFGTLNTMMMAVFERTREIGNLSAMGVGPRQILTAFLVESFFLGVTGLAVGFLAGGALLYHLSTEGLNLSRWTGEFTIVNSRVDPVLKAEWMWVEMTWAAVGLMLAVLLATVIPSVRAARMDPVEALQAPTQG
jgi:ABC-type lipoprotein release transport system permease subunit